MIRRRRADERGFADHGWLQSHHSFSFASYVDPEHTHFRALRVLNDDIVAPGAGFPAHGHADMEIVTYVIEGALEHSDSMGSGSVLRSGDVQRMSAGRGVRHSEYNPSPDETLRLLQIWVLPDRKGLEPEYEEAHFPLAERRGRLRPIVTPDGREGSLSIHQDAAFLATILEKGEGVRHALAPGRHAWIQIARGQATVGDVPLEEGDGAAVSEEVELVIAARSATELLVIDLA